MILRSQRRAETTGRARSRLSQRSNPNSWQRLRPWRLTDRSTDDTHAPGVEHARRVRNHQSKKKLALAGPSFSLRLADRRSIENLRSDLDKDRKDVEHVDITKKCA